VTENTKQIMRLYNIYGKFYTVSARFTTLNRPRYKR